MIDCKAFENFDGHSVYSSWFPNYLCCLKSFDMKKLAYLLLLCTLVLTACHRNSQPMSEEEAYQKYIKNPGNGRSFGDKVDVKNAITYDELLTRLKKADKVATTVRGKVGEVCMAKGCWMTVASADGSDPIFVKFKDYAFFMPKDIVGKQVVMTGEAFKEVTTVEMLRHFAEDAGKSKAEIMAINTPKEELKFMASGVAVVE